MKRLKPIIRIFPSIFLMGLGISSMAQKVDSIYFNLYTDSLKKGTYNYINVDGKLSNGSWLPLTAKEIIFTTSAGKFDNNCLVLDRNFTEEKVTVKAVLKSDTSISRSITIFIKRKEDNEKLKTADEILREMEQQGRDRTRRKS
jgi:hypothetical protein